MSTVSLKLKTRVFTDSNHVVSIVNGSGVNSSVISDPKRTTTSFTATPTVSTQATILTITFTAKTGYYYPVEPNYVITSASASAFQITETRTQDSKKRILSKVFVVKYTNSVNLSNQLIKFNYELEKYLFTPAQINAFINNNTLLEIKSLVIDDSYLESTGGARSLQVTGDPGSFFNLKIIKTAGADTTYDYVLDQFTSTVTELLNQSIDDSGVYSTQIVFPQVNADDVYRIELVPVFALGTTIDDLLVPVPSTNENNEFLITRTIQQFKKVDIVLSLLSAGSNSSYNTLPSNITISGERNSSLTTPTSVTWPVSLSQNALYISRQPIELDFRSTKVQNVNGAVSSGAVIVLHYIDGLFPGLVVSGTGVPVGTRIIHLAEETNTITLSANVADGGVSNGQALSFTYGGSVTSSNISGHEFRVGSVAEDGSNPKFKVVLSDVATKVNGAVSGSKIVNVDSQAGILARSTVFVSGRGIDGSTVLPHVDAITSGGVANRLQLSVNQTLEDNVDLVFTGSSRSATITFDYYVDNFGTSDITLTLFLDNIIPVE
tara:strand:+ start:6456 stop:8102 length:1647 start_codon:yes stop_codon:yes gene_type:complete